MPTLPTGTVTLLFTDIEGSTQLLHELGPEEYGAALADHRLKLRSAFAAHAGVEVDTQGDAFFVAFSLARDALLAAADAQAALSGGPVRVRMGIHTGTPRVTDGSYVGEDVHLGARVGAAGHGGQVLVSKATREVVGAEPSIQLLDLGEHRLKDFATPVWIYQLGAQAFPPLRTISNTNLPRPASSFVGREREVGALGSLVANGARLITLTGPGGSGKTRLAVEAAAELVPEFANGVFWVPLASLRDAGLVEATIAQTLGAEEDLTTFIGVRRMLLALDNLEQVIGVAPALAALVAACPNLCLMVTSRELLRVAGEVEYPVRPLGNGDAVELFCARAGLPAADEVRELCFRLDNLPLAVELAAARARVLTPGQMIERLGVRLDLLKGGRDADPRQQTLRATIAWSHDLLSPAEKALFAGFTAFRGGGDLDAIEAVCGADIDDLQALVDKSLVVHTDDRFSMLESIREFGRQQLEASTAADGVLAGHADYFVALAERIEPTLRGNPKAGLDKLEVEHDNMRAAYEYLRQVGRHQDNLRLCAALPRFWNQRLHVAEGYSLTQAALAAAPEQTPARAGALIAALELAAVSGDFDAARRWQREALATALAVGDDYAAATAEFDAMFYEEDVELQLAIPEKAIGRFLALGDSHQALVAMTNAAYAAFLLGQLDRQLELLNDALRLARQTGNVRVEARCLQGLAERDLMAGRAAPAAQMILRSSQFYESFGETAEVVANIALGGWALGVAGLPERGAILMFAAESLRRQLHFLDDRMDAAAASAAPLLAGRLEQSALERARSAGEAMKLESAVSLAATELEAIGAGPAPG